MGVHKQFPHEEYRPGQEAAVEWLQTLKGPGLLHAPTGTGKTATISTLPGIKLTALMEFKDLQDQYSTEPYPWKALKGQANYQCALLPNKTFETCVYKRDPLGLRACEEVDNCSYLKAKRAATSSRFAALNYALWNVVREGWTYDRLILDEAHAVGDIVIDWAGIIITKELAEKYGMPRPPMIKYRRKPGQLQFSAVSRYLDKVFDALNVALEEAESQNEEREVERLIMKLSTTADAIEHDRADWYVNSGKGAALDKVAFVARPLTARHHFAHYFGTEPLLMTATPGPYASFATELGIDPKKLQVHRVPHPFKPKDRPIVDMGCAGMGQGAKLKDRKAQAMAIIEAIENKPGDWAALIHTNSYKQAWDLANRLRAETNRSVTVPDQRQGKDEQVAEWKHILDQAVGPIRIAPNLHAGYDGSHEAEKISIVAKVPYPFMLDPYEKARQLYNGRSFYLRAARKMEQAFGRVRRSEADYGPDATFVGIADGDWKRVAAYITDDIKEAIV